MEALSHLAKSIDYIEAHLADKVDMEEVAAIAHFSKFHYQRMFYMLIGVTPRVHFHTKQACNHLHKVNSYRLASITT